MSHSQLADGGHGRQIGKVAKNILNKSRTADKGLSSTLGLVVGMGIPHYKTLASYEMLHRASELDMLFWMTLPMENRHEIWDFECQNSLETVFIGNCRKRIIRVKIRYSWRQDVGRDQGGNKPAVDYTFFYGKPNASHKFLERLFRT
jgi:hypothetical protein